MKKVLFEKQKNIALVTFNNPQKLNPLDFEVLEELNVIMDDLDKEDIRCVILTGAGEKAFIAGGDIGVQNTFDVTAAYRWACLGHATLRRIERLSVPVIGAINGFALGGGTEVALVCDCLVAAKEAIFGQPEVTLGITPGFGGTQRLARKIGINLAKELILTGRRFSAEEAKEIGLVNKVTSREQVLPEAFDFAEQIIKHSRYAVEYAKKAVDQGIQVDLDRGLEIERTLFSLCFDTEEQTIAMTNFLNKGKKK